MNSINNSSAFTSEDITQFATGSLEACFGEAYAIYRGRLSPRTPNGDLQLISRVLGVDGTAGEFKTESKVVAEYDVPADAWFYAQNASASMPYSVLMEIALQPCGFLSTYMGASLIYPDQDLKFRNLDANATTLKDLDLRGQTITAEATLKTVASSAMTIILTFDFSLKLGAETFYQGNTVFGYFTAEQMSSQLGLDRGQTKLPWFKENKMPLKLAQNMPLSTQAGQEAYFQGTPEKPHFRLSGERLNFLENALVFGTGGEHDQGYVYAQKRVDAADWFFKYHFFEDPVMPGSLGVEAILQSLKAYAIAQDLGQTFANPCFVNALGNVAWKYRGQIIGSDGLMTLETSIKSIEMIDGQLVVTADAYLSKDGLRIYRVTDVAIAIAEASR